MSIKYVENDVEVSSLTEKVASQKKAFEEKHKVREANSFFEDNKQEIEGLSKLFPGQEKEDLLIKSLDDMITHKRQLLPQHFPEVDEQMRVEGIWIAEEVWDKEAIAEGVIRGDVSKMTATKEEVAEIDEELQDIE